jgi:hypothetical protein
MSQLLIHQQEHRRKRRNKFLFRLGLILFFLLVIFLTLVFVSRMQRFRISDVELSGETLVSQNEVVEASDDFLSGYYLGLFPRDNAFIFPRAVLQNFLKEKFKRIDLIKIKLDGFKKLQIIISERQQQALWCAGSPDGFAEATSSSDLDRDKCYFLDDNGLIFSGAPSFSGNAYFKYYGGISIGTSPAGSLPTDSASSGTPIGQTYLSTSTVFQDVSDFVQSIGQTSITPVSILAGDNGDFTMYLSTGGKIYFNQSEPLSKTADNLKALLQTLSESSSTSILNIDYIDLRFGDKLYYKMK